MEFLQQTWVVVAAAIGGITLVWNFIHKTLQEVKAELKRPFVEINEKIDHLEKKINISADHDTQVQRALLTMQRNSLLRSCEEFLRRGYATSNEKSTISDQYTSYSELGGDQFISDLVAQVMKLPIEQPEEPKRNKKKSKKESAE